jgi:predicted RNA-binding Zn-ribbon protein involved in translation (DUF1610 family)
VTESVVKRGMETYYSLSAAKGIVHLLPAQNAAVEGIEGFRMTDTVTEPLMDYIAHWPGLPSSPRDKYVELCAFYCMQVLTEWASHVPRDFMVALAIDRSRFTCPVCGYVRLMEEARSPRTGGGSYEICPSCGFQFGVTDDDRGLTYEQWRQRWIEDGMLWNSAGIDPPPTDWNPAEQLRRLLEWSE